MPDLSAEFESWWAASYPNARPNPQSAAICVAFAEHVAGLAAQGAAPVAWCRSDDFLAAAAKRQSFNGWREQHHDCDMALYSAQPPAPAPASDGEVADLVEFLRIYGDHVMDEFGDVGEHDQLTRAAALLEQCCPAPAPAPAAVPVAVSKALIKAECALADVAEGERWCEEGDILQWAERRCANALAAIRPVMKQHQIRTSEWPPLPQPPQGEEVQP